MEPEERNSLDHKSTMMAALRHGGMWFLGWSIAGLLRDGYIDWGGGLSAALGATTVMYFLVGKDPSLANQGKSDIWLKALRVPLWMLGAMVAVAMFVGAFVFQDHQSRAPQLKQNVAGDALDRRSQR